MEHGIELFEVFGALLGMLLFVSRFFAPLKRFLLVLQIALFLHKFLSKYFKDHPEKKEQMKNFVVQVINHYLRTHPKGQDISRKTDLNEEVNKLLGIDLTKAKVDSR